MADDHGAARIVFESVFQGTQRFDVKVIGRLVEQEDIAALLQELRHVNAVALTAGKLADLLLLIATLEIEGPHIGAGLEFMLADGHEIMAAGNFLRSEERRVGKGCVSTCRSRWSPLPKKKQHSVYT